jgi:hypothetical protein
MSAIFSKSLISDVGFSLSSAIFEQSKRTSPRAVAAEQTLGRRHLQVRAYQGQVNAVGVLLTIPKRVLLHDLCFLAKAYHDALIIRESESIAHAMY